MFSLTFIVSQTSPLLTVAKANKLVAFRGRRETRIENDEKPEDERDNARRVQHVRRLIGHDGRARVCRRTRRCGCVHVLRAQDAQQARVARSIAIVRHGRPGHVHDVEGNKWRLEHARGRVVLLNARQERDNARHQAQD